MKQSTLNTNFAARMIRHANNHHVAVTRIKTVSTAAISAAYIGKFLVTYQNQKFCLQWTIRYSKNVLTLSDTVREFQKNITQM